jgi:hypothetical protein
MEQAILECMQECNTHRRYINSFQTLFGDAQDEDDELYGPLLRRCKALQQRRRQLFTTVPMTILLQAYQQAHSRYLKAQILRKIYKYRIAPIHRFLLSSSTNEEKEDNNLQQIRGYIQDMRTCISLKTTQILSYPHFDAWCTALQKRLEEAEGLAFMMMAHTRLGAHAQGRDLDTELLRCILHPDRLFSSSFHT